MQDQCSCIDPAVDFANDWLARYCLQRDPTGPCCPAVHNFIHEKDHVRDVIQDPFGETRSNQSIVFEQSDRLWCCRKNAVGVEIKDQRRAKGACQSGIKVSICRIHSEIEGSSARLGNTKHRNLRNLVIHH